MAAQFNQSYDSIYDGPSKMDIYSMDADFSTNLNKRLQLLARMRAMAEYGKGDYYEARPEVGLKFGPAYAMGGKSFDSYSDDYGQYNDQYDVGEFGLENGGFGARAKFFEGRKPKYSLSYQGDAYGGNLSANYSPLQQAIMLNFNRSF